MRKQHHRDPFSALLTLYTKPVVYLQLDRLRMRWKVERVQEPAQA
jgi:hypothetical protein